MPSITPGQVAAVLLCLVGVAGWVWAVVAQFRAAGSARPEFPWTVRVNPLRMLVNPEAQTQHSRLWWRRYVFGVATFLASILVVATLLTWGGVQPIRM